MNNYMCVLKIGLSTKKSRFVFAKLWFTKSSLYEPSCNGVNEKTSQFTLLYFKMLLLYILLFVLLKYTCNLASALNSSFISTIYVYFITFLFQLFSLHFGHFRYLVLPKCIDQNTSLYFGIYL